MVPSERTTLLSVGLLAVPSSLPSLRYGQLEPLQLPSFRVGTLDSLLALSETLTRHDGTATQLALKIAQEFPVEFTATGEPLVIDFHRYQSFRWDQAKYGQTEQVPLPQLFHQVWRHLEDLERGFRSRQEEYNRAKQNWQSLEQCFSGGLTFRPLSSLVRREQVLQTEHLCTIFLLVGTRELETFLRTYETLSSFVVPRSASLITQDDDHALYSLVVFRKGLNEFLRAARECRYQVREYREETHSEDANLDERLVKARTHWQQIGLSFREWSSEAYVDCIDALIHLKVMRLFVEGVLRYGLPVSFAASWVLFEKQQESKIRKALLEELQQHHPHQHTLHPLLAGDRVELPPIAGLDSADNELAYDEEPFIWLTIDAVFRR